MRLRKITIITPSNGSIWPAITFLTNDGANVTFSASPQTGYTISQWYINGAPRGTSASQLTVSNIRADFNIEVRFAAQPRFIVTGSEVLDNNTGLRWQRDANGNGEITWSSAMNRAGGGWRVPIRNELATLAPLPSGHPFLNVYNSAWWSSTTDNFGQNAWTVNLLTGTHLSRHKQATSLLLLVK